MGGCYSAGGKEAPGGGAKAPTDKNADKEANKDFQQRMNFLKTVSLFRSLPPHERPILAQLCENVEFKEKDTIIKQGEAGSEFFVIKTGEASVHIASEPGGEAKKMATLKARDFFGEAALLREEPRTATIIADTPITALRITRENFRAIGLNEKLQFANRKAVGAGGGGRALAIQPPSPKTEEEKTLIASALRQNEALQTMVTLDRDRVDAMIAVAWKETVAKGTDVITEGDLQADYFYVVQSGSFEVLLSDGGASQGQGQSAEKALTKGESKFVSNIKEGESFGELALLYLVPRAATVRAKVDSVVWVFDRQNFKSILMKSSAQKIKEFVEYLNKVPILDPLLADEKLAMAQALVEMHFAQKEIILNQGEPGNTFYILYEGTVSVLVNGKQVDELKSSRGGEVQVFGERALLANEPRAATVEVTSESAKALALDRDSFNILLGPLENIRERGAQGTSKVGTMNKLNTPTDKQREKIMRRDLMKIGLIGCGGFGTVELWEHRATKETYAMKGLSKGYIVKTGMQDSVMNEKNILMMTNSPFIVRLWETYSGSQTLYFLMQPCLGGELYATYNRKGFHGSESHAKFYVAGTICAFDHMHQRRIIYRDLKPENLLLTETGALMVTDMGLAKFVLGKTYTTCGTPDYFAPELIASTGHTNAVDWWTLGILIFELMSGHPPFESAYPMQIYSKVMKGINKVHFPAKCQGTVGDLIKALLKKEPSERLPAKGVQHLKSHKWFNNFDWDAFCKLTMDPPYKPMVKSKKDIANFAARKEDMPKQIEYHDDGSGWDKDFASA
jgi:cGMP-dependent protein kinase